MQLSLKEKKKGSPDVPSAVVLGGRNMLGQALVSELLNRGWAVHTLERPLHDDVPTVFTPEELTRRITELQPAAVLNAEAWSQINEAEDEPDAAMAVNSGLPAILGRIVRSLPDTWLVQYSTSYVFDGAKRTPYVETDVPNPLNVYGKTKLAGEQTLEKLDIPHCLILRVGWLFGPQRENLLSKLLQRAREKGVLTMVHDVYGSPTYTCDLAVATMELLQRKESGLFHFANSGQATICELTAETLRLGNRPMQVVGVSSAEQPQAARRPPYSVLSCEKYTKATGLTPRSWVQALREYVFSGFLDED